MKELFLNEKPVLALVTIYRQDETYGSKVAREIDTTYAHTVRIIQRLNDEELIRSRKDGRKKLVRLTEQGEQYAAQFDRLVRMFGGEAVQA